MQCLGNTEAKAVLSLPVVRCANNPSLYLYLDLARFFPNCVADDASAALGYNLRVHCRHPTHHKRMSPRLSPLLHSSSNHLILSGTIAPASFDRWTGIIPSHHLAVSELLDA